MEHFTPQSSNGIKILCVEDEQFISELYVRALTKAGYEVTTESDGRRALAAAQTNEFDIILLDLMIPGITGIEVLRQIRSDGKPLKSKIIITTNLEQRPEIRKDIESQADGYIVKAGITPHELVDFLATVN